MADFGPLGGVKVTGFISPTDTNDTYAVIDPWYGIDGLRNYSGGTSNLHTISELRRRAGMWVGLSGGTEYYKLNPGPWIYDITDWSLINIGTGGTGTISFTEHYFTASSDGQTYFTGELPTQPTQPLESEFYLNGQKQRYGLVNDYVLSGGTNQDFVWMDNLFTLNVTDELNIRYR